MCCTRIAENTWHKNNIRHLRTIAKAQICPGIYLRNQGIYRHSKKLLNINTSSQYGKLWPASGWDGWRVWDTPANLNGFRVLASLLHRRRSTDVKHTLHDVCPSPGGGALSPNGMPGAKFTLLPSLAFICIGSVTARHPFSCDKNK